jgi:hypothetical protein
MRINRIKAALVGSVVVPGLGERGIQSALASL